MDELLPLFKILSDETRLKIISLMREGEICVCDITDNLDLTQPNVSFHLSMMKEAGIIKERKNGRWKHFSLDDSDIFRRFLFMGIFERMKELPVKEIKRSKKC